MDHRSAFEVLWYQAHLFFNVHEVIAQLRDPETKGSVFEYQISRSVIIDELANVPAFMTERTKPLYIFKGPVWLSAHRHGYLRHLVPAVIDVHIHHIFL